LLRRQGRPETVDYAAGLIKSWIWFWMRPCPSN